MLTSGSAYASGAILQGTCVDIENNPVSYVNVIVTGTDIWTISSKDGRFTINLPDSIQDQTLSFGHISYNPVQMEAKGFAGPQDGEGRKVVMYERAFELAPVTVLAKAPKIRNLNSIGEISQFVRLEIPFHDHEYKSIGQLVKLKNKTHISEFQLRAMGHTYDTLLLRVVLYQVDGKKIEPLMKEPHYFSIPRNTTIKKPVVCDLSEYNIVAKGKIMANVEYVYSEGDGVALLPVCTGSTNIVMFLYPEDEWGSLPGIGAGFLLKGTYLD